MHASRKFGLNIVPLLSHGRLRLSRSSTVLSRFDTYKGRSLGSSKLRQFSNVSELRNRLKEEMKYESENDTTSSDKKFIDSYLAKNSWMVEDTMGGRYVKFIKNHGKNKISAVVDLNTVGEENESEREYQEDEYDEDQEEETGDNPLPENDTLNVSAVVEFSSKPEKGALKFDLVIQDDELFIQRVEYFKNSSQAFGAIYGSTGATEPHKYYTGPQFYTLDNDIQGLYRKYTEELGLDSKFAKFVYSYSISKEHKEYTSWLKKTHDFLQDE